MEGGSGLGLTVVKSIVRAHQGSIQILDGPDGKGAVFVMYIPLIK